ncbi:MAG: YihY family inner membrane protein [Betaproteobacteria bacterium]|nr:YihY family inner membrane protein [Betaproteobacteria bacterium]
MPRPLLILVIFLRYVDARFREDRCVQVAASLTFTTLLSLVPLITVAVTLIAAFPVFSELSSQLKVFLLTNMVPEIAGKIITEYMQQFADNAARLTAVGIVLLGVTAITMMFTIDRALNAIWRVSRPRPLLQRLLIYWAVLTVGPLMMGASLSLTSWLVTLSMGLAKSLPAVAVLLLKVMPVVLAVIAFAALYLTVPNRYVPPLHALAGGAVGALAFELMKRGFGLYVSSFPTYKLVYGAFATIPIFLLWVYLSWMVVLLGAEIAASLSAWRGAESHRTRPPGYRFHDALRLLGSLCRAFKSGQVRTFIDLRRELKLGFEEMEQILETLAAADLARKVVGNGWVLIRDPAEIRVAEVFRMFAYQPAAGRPPQAGEERLDELFASLSLTIEQGLDATLEALFAGSDNLLRYPERFTENVSKAKS